MISPVSVFRATDGVRRVVVSMRNFISVSVFCSVGNFVEGFVGHIPFALALGELFIRQRTAVLFGCEEQHLPAIGISAEHPVSPAESHCTKFTPRSEYRFLHPSPDGDHHLCLWHNLFGFGRLSVCHSRTFLLDLWCLNECSAKLITNEIRCNIACDNYHCFKLY